MFRDTKINYFTSNMPVSSFETDRRKFLGDNEYGTWANPASLQKEEFSNTEALRGDNIAALMHHLGILKPGQSRRLITLLGQESNLEAADPSLNAGATSKQSIRRLRNYLHFGIRIFPRCRSTRLMRR